MPKIKSWIKRLINHKGE